MLRALVVFLVAAILLGGGSLLVLHAYDQPGPLPDGRPIAVPRGSLEQIAEVLSQQGVIGNPLALRLAALVTRGQGALRSAELYFPTRASLRTVLVVLRTGKPVQHRFTIPEGLTAAQVAAALQRGTALEGDVLMPEEGSLLPETYLYELGTARSAVLERARRAMDKALDAAWSARTPGAGMLSSPRDALILASIVERETNRADERGRIAGVFINRLRRGMRLQSDPTVVYGASGGLGVLDHGITRAELDRDDPYNTYRIPGLPPGPIAMPGLAALKAATQPWAGDELYFVADGQGGHLFAKTEAEHQRNVAKWREVERQRAALPPKPVQN